jgi:hypothetical protein
MWEGDADARPGLFLCTIVLIGLDKYVEATVLGASRCVLSVMIAISLKMLSRHTA